MTNIIRTIAKNNNRCTTPSKTGLFTKYVVGFLAFAVFIEPPIFSVLDAFNGNIHAIYKLLKLSLCAILLFLMLSKIETSYAFKDAFFPLLFLVVPRLFSTLIYGGDLISAFNLIVSFVGCVLLSLYIFNGDFKSFCIVISVYLSLLVLLNLIAQIIEPDGIVSIYREGSYVYDRFWVLGGKNSFAPFCLSLAFFSSVLVFHFSKKKYILSYLLSVISLLISRSSTSILGIAVFSLLLFIANWPRFKKKRSLIFDFRFYCIVVAVLSVILLSNGLVFLRSVVSNLFGKDSTLTGRVEIWRLVVERIKEKPLFGYGILSQSDMYSEIGFSHSHNYYLNVLFQGGCVSLLFFLFFIHRISKRIELIPYCLLQHLYSIAIFSFLIVFLTEYFDENRFLLPFYLMAFSIFLIDGSKKGALSNVFYSHALL